MSVKKVSNLPSLVKEAEDLLAWLFLYLVRPAFALACVPSCEDPSWGPLDWETAAQLGVLVWGLLGLENAGAYQVLNVGLVHL